MHMLIGNGGLLFSCEQCQNRACWSRSLVWAGRMYRVSLGRLARAPSSFQSVVSMLRLWANKSVYVLFKSGVLVFCSPLVSPSGVQTSQRGSSSPCWTAGTQCGVQTPHSSERIPEPVRAPLSSGPPPGAVGPNKISFPPLLSDSLGFFLHSLGCRRGGKEILLGPTAPGGGPEDKGALTGSGILSEE